MRYIHWVLTVGLHPTLVYYALSGLCGCEASLVSITFQLSNFLNPYIILTKNALIVGR